MSRLRLSFTLGTGELSLFYRYAIFGRLIAPSYEICHFCRPIDYTYITLSSLANSGGDWRCTFSLKIED
jgi:hypothetical protein